MTDNAPQNDAPSKSRLGGILKWIFMVFAAVTFGSAGYIAYDAFTFLYTPASADPQERIIDILPGSTFDRVAWDLKKAGALSDVTRFRILAKIKGKLGSIQAGEFTVNTGWSPDKLLMQITSGKPNLYRLALREGLPWWEVARLVEEGGFAKAAEFEAVIHGQEFLRQYGIPFANAEGFLYPETYLLRKPRTLGGKQQAETVARILVETFWKRSWPMLVEYAAADTSPKGTPVLLPNFTLRGAIPIRVAPATMQSDGPSTPAATDAYGQTNAVAQADISESLTKPGESIAQTKTQAATPAERQPVPQPTTQIRQVITHSPLQVPVSAEALRYLVILASLVEKETGVAEERARVAGVYANRMRIGMLLQCDPTIIYGLGKKQSGPIRRSQLDDASNLYNSYKHPGLPPGPICSPGAASTKAAVSPEQHKYIFFVATGQPDGTHTFSTNVEEHNRAVRVFRASQGR